MNNMAQVASKNCDICEEKPLKEFCLDCEQYFCEKCKTQHLKSKISRDHTFQDGKNFKGVPKAKCSDHEQDFIFVCVQCDVPICKLCTTQNHNGHKLSDIQDKISSLKSTIESEIKTKTGKYKEYLEKLDQNIQSSIQREKSAISAVCDDGKKIKNMVDTRVAGIVASIKDGNKKEIEKLKEFSNKVHKSMNDIDFIRKKYDNSLKNTVDNATLLVQLKQLLGENNKQETLELTVDVLSIEYKRGRQADVDKLLGSLDKTKNCIISTRPQIVQAPSIFGSRPQIASGIFGRFDTTQFPSKPEGFTFSSRPQIASGIFGFDTAQLPSKPEGFTFSSRPQIASGIFGGNDTAQLPSKGFTFGLTNQTNEYE